MDFIPLTTSSTADVGVWVMVAGLGLGILGFLGMYTRWFKATVVTLIAAALAVVVGMPTTIVGSVGLTKERAVVREERVAAVQDEYGLALTGGEYSRLYFPDEKPKSDFEVFGSVERDTEKPGGGFERQTIYLIWQDDELRLAESADGEVFDVLGD